MFGDLGTLQTQTLCLLLSVSVGRLEAGPCSVDLFCLIQASQCKREFLKITCQRCGVCVDLQARTSSFFSKCVVHEGLNGFCMWPEEKGEDSHSY